VQVVEHGPLLRPDLEHVAETGGRQQSDPGSATLDERVRRDRRAVHEVGDGPGVDAQRVDGGHEPAGEVLRLRPHLGDRKPARTTDAHGVRERPSDVDADAYPGHRDERYFDRLAGCCCRRPPGGDRIERDL
jgi:hypothetical protein